MNFLNRGIVSQQKGIVLEVLKKTIRLKAADDYCAQNSNVCLFGLNCMFVFFCKFWGAVLRPIFCVDPLKIFVLIYKGNMHQKMDTLFSTLILSAWIGGRLGVRLSLLSKKTGTAQIKCQYIGIFYRHRGETLFLVEILYRFWLDSLGAGSSVTVQIKYMYGGWYRRPKKIKLNDFFTNISYPKAEQFINEVSMYTYWVRYSV